MTTDPDSPVKGKHARGTPFRFWFFTPESKGRLAPHRGCNCGRTCTAGKARGRQEHLLSATPGAHAQPGARQGARDRRRPERLPTETHPVAEGLGQHPGAPAEPWLPVTTPQEVDCLGSSCFCRLDPREASDGPCLARTALQTPRSPSCLTLGLCTGHAHHGTQCPRARLQTWLLMKSHTSRFSLN